MSTASKAKVWITGAWTGFLGLLVHFCIEVAKASPDKWHEVFTIRDIYRSFPALVSFVVIFTVLGVFQHGAKDMLKSVREASRQLTMVGGKLACQDDWLKLMFKSDRHGGLVSALVKQASETLQPRTIPDVSTNKYISYLELALAQSDSYFGIEKEPIRSFKEERTSAYLDKLNERPMKEKIRVFVVGGRRLKQMEEDLKNQELLSWYWDKAADVETYWIDERKIRELSWPIPEDLALYDDCLLLSYSKGQLTFDIIGEHEDWIAKHILDELHAQKANSRSTPFIKVEPLTSLSLVP